MTLQSDAPLAAAAPSRFLQRLTAEQALRYAGDCIAIGELNACFGFALDHACPEQLSDLFTHDAVYRSGANQLRGRSAIVVFFQERAALGPRTTRHLCSSQRLMFSADPDDAARTVTGLSVWMSYAANADAPIDEVTPFMVADFVDLYRLEDDGHWRIAERSIDPVFKNAGAAPRSVPDRVSDRAP
jgi:hypothetical protein